MRSGKIEQATPSDFQLSEKSEIMETLQLHFDRRSGIERRRISYVAHIPERRSGTDRRDSGERRRKLLRMFSGSRLWEELYGNESNLDE
jgi:hypothetical protein